MSLTLEQKVEALTNLSIEASSSSPTHAELSNFLSEGAKDVINKIIVLKPEELYKFCIESKFTSDDGMKVEGHILSVGRDADDVDAGITDFKPASEIPAALRHLASDQSSIYFRSKYNPAFYRQDGRIYLIPIPTVNEKGLASTVRYPKIEHSHTQISSDSIVLTGVKADGANPTVFDNSAPHGLVAGVTVKLSGFNEALDLNGITSVVETVTTNTFTLQSITETTSETTGGSVESIGNQFPDQYTDLTVTYASYKSLFRKLGVISDSLNPINITAVPPSIVNITTPAGITLGTAPEYIPPLFSLESQLSISDLTITTPSVTPPVIDFSAIDTSGITNPNFAAPSIVPPNWADLETQIVTNEDSELAELRVAEAKVKVTEFMSHINNAKEKFNEEDKILQKDLQIAINNASLAEKGKLANYATEVQNYTSSVNKEVQEFQANFQKEFQVWEKFNNQGVQKYSIDVQNALNDFNEENTRYVTELQKDIKQAEITVGVNQNILVKYQGEVKAYIDEVNKSVQEYQSILGQHGAEYKWMQERYLTLKKEYDDYFLMIRPPVKEKKDAN